MKKLKIFFALLSVFILVFTTTVSASAAESKIETELQEEIKQYVAEGKLEDWHLEMMVWDGYITFYNKCVHFNQHFDRFAEITEDEIWWYITMYQNHWNETWEYVIDNLDIWPEYLEQDTILGLYWDSYFCGEEDEGYLYLIWVSHYTPSEFVTITEFKESGKIYKLYDDLTAQKDLDANWETSDEFHFSNADITLHITPVGGFRDGESFGVPLKRKYKFEGFTYGIDDGEYSYEVDPENKFGGKCEDVVNFDLGLVPKQDGQNALQLVTHGYTIIKNCEAQSYYDLNFGGYKHEVYFNTSIDIDKIYRVDVSYKVTNQDKEWYEFWKPDDEHQVTKSLTTERVNGGFFGLSKYQGFEEGNYQSTRNSSTRYKYKLHLNYDDDGWKIFRGSDLKEGDYERISNFEILRLNFLVDNEIYDIKVAMDQIDSNKLNILHPDLIMDADSGLFKFKDTIYDFFSDIKTKFVENKGILWAVAGGVLLVIIIFGVLKTYKWFSRILSVLPDSKDKNKNKRE